MNSRDTIKLNELNSIPKFPDSNNFEKHQTALTESLTEMASRIENKYKISISKIENLPPKSKASTYLSLQIFLELSKFKEPDTKKIKIEFVDQGLKNFMYRFLLRNQKVLNIKVRSVELTTKFSIEIDKLDEKMLFPKLLNADSKYCLIKSILLSEEAKEAKEDQLQKNPALNISIKTFRRLITIINNRLVSIQLQLKNTLFENISEKEYINLRLLSFLLKESEDKNNTQLDCIEFVINDTELRQIACAYFDENKRHFGIDSVERKLHNLIITMSPTSVVKSKTDLIKKLLDPAMNFIECVNINFIDLTKNTIRDSSSVSSTSLISSQLLTLPTEDFYSQQEFGTADFFLGREETSIPPKKRSHEEINAAEGVKKTKITEIVNSPFSTFSENNRSPEAHECPSPSFNDADFWPSDNPWDYFSRQ